MKTLKIFGSILLLAFISCSKPEVECSLEKIEELFLHTIEQQKIIEDLEEENEGLKGRLEKIEQALGL